MEVSKIVELINAKTKTVQQIADSEGVSKRTIQRRIKDAGYTYNNRKKVYEKEYKCEDIYCNDCNELKVSRTYSIPSYLDKALKHKAIDEGKDFQDIVVESLKEYLQVSEQKNLGVN